MDVYIESMVGKVFTKVERQTIDGEDFLIFENAAEKYKFYHYSDCCESVYIDNICGELIDLENSPLIVAEESSNDCGPGFNGSQGSDTWTFYKFATIKGWVDVRWFGTSNGFYSEAVSLEYVNLLISEKPDAA